MLFLPRSFAQQSVLSACAVVASLLFVGTACTSLRPTAPPYTGAKGAEVSDDVFPAAIAHYVYSLPTDRVSLARPLADRLLVRSQGLFEAQRERGGLAAVRLAATWLRTSDRPASELSQLSDAAVRALDSAIAGPAARGNEGASRGIYLLWSLARPNDERPQLHLRALSRWESDAVQVPTSQLISVARRATVSVDEDAFSALHVDRSSIRNALLQWMELVAAFKDGERTPERYNDEVFAAVTGLRTSALRLVALYLRDGDVSGAAEALEHPQLRGFLPETIGEAIASAGPRPTAEAYKKIILSLFPATKVDGVDEMMQDAMIGTAMVGIAEHPRSTFLAEIVARGLYLVGAGDAAPGVLGYALIGRPDDPRRPPSRELGRALSLTSSVIRDFADRGDHAASRRAFAASRSLLGAADHVGEIAPSSADVKSLMAEVEGEAGFPSAARALYEDALATSPSAMTLVVRALFEAHFGHVEEARGWVTRALSTKDLAQDAAVHAETLAAAGDLARRAGDWENARSAYEESLRVLTSMQPRAKGEQVAEIGYAIARTLLRLGDVGDRFEEVLRRAETSAGHQRGLLTRISILRFFPLFRQADPSRAAEALARSGGLSLAPVDGVRAAVLTLSLFRRAGMASDPAAIRVLTAASSRDDFAGLVARHALGTLDAKALLARTSTPQELAAARFSVAILRWGLSGLAATKDELTLVARGDVVGSAESELALDLIEPDRAIVPPAHAADTNGL